MSRRDASRFTLNRRPLQFVGWSLLVGDSHQLVAVFRIYRLCRWHKDLASVSGRDDGTCRNVNPVRSAALKVVKNQQMWNSFASTNSQNDLS